MTGSNKFECFFIEYVRNVLSRERLSIAAVFIDASDPERGFWMTRFAPDWRNKVQAFDPDTDLEMLSAFLTDLRNRLHSPMERSGMLHQLEDSFSNTIQISPRRECPVATTPETIETFASISWERSLKL